MESSTVTIKGQIVIPASIRRKTGIRRGTRVYIEEKGGDIIVHPATRALLERWRGIFKGSGATRMLLEERRKDKIREERFFK